MIGEVEMRERSPCGAGEETHVPSFKGTPYKQFT